jgi:uncharacterized protein YrrD
MNEQPEFIKQSQLLGRLVLDRQTTEAIGKIERLWFDPRTHQVIAIACKSGLFKKRLVAWERIHSIGKDSIVVNSSPTSDWEEQAETEWEKSGDSVIGRELWTDAGNKVGKIEDCLLELGTGTAIRYLFVSSGWGGLLNRLYMLPPEAIASMGSKRVLVSVEAVQTSEPYSEGLNKLIAQATELIREDRDKTQQEITAVKEKFGSLLAQFKGEAQPMLAQAQEKAQAIASQAMEQAQQKGQVLKEQVQAIASQAQEKAQTVAQQAKEKAQELAGEAQKRIPQAETPELSAGEPEPQPIQDPEE